MEKVLLINPYNPESDHIQPPLGLGYLATALRKANITVSICDANKLKISPRNLQKVISGEKPSFDGFQFYTANYSYIKEGLALIKKISPETLTLVGGPYPSALPAITMKEMGQNLDYAFAGEAEIGLPLLIQKKAALEKIPGLIFRQNAKVTVNPLLFHPHLDDFDFPAWDLLKPETYPASQHGAFFKNFPIAPILTTRGCPFNCSFCAGKVNTGSLLRKRSVGNVIKEIKYNRKFDF